MNTFIHSFKQNKYLQRVFISGCTAKHSNKHARSRLKKNTKTLSFIEDRLKTYIHTYKH